MCSCALSPSASGHKLTGLDELLDRRWRRSSHLRKHAYRSPCTCGPSIKDTYLRFRGAVVLIRPPCLMRGIAVPTAIHISMATSLNNVATLAAGVSASPQIAIVEPTAPKATEVLFRFTWPKVNPASI